MFFFFRNTATTESDPYLHTLSLHDALPIWGAAPTGVLDLADCNVADAPLRRLDDGWTFYWGELVDPAALAAAEPPGGGRPVQIPAAWDMRELEGSGSAGKGIATYHLRLLLPAAAPPLAIRLPATYSASVLWVDGVALIEIGRAHV